MKTNLVVSPTFVLVISALATACSTAASNNPNAASGGSSPSAGGATGSGGGNAGSAGSNPGGGATGSAGTSSGGTSGAAGQGATSGSAGAGQAGSAGNAGSAGAGQAGSSGASGSGGAGQAGSAGQAGTSGASGNGGAGQAGSGGASGNGGAGQAGSGGASGNGGAGGGGTTMGPCDIYSSGNTPCVAAYSTVRSLSSKYSGPLYQVRKGGSNSTTTGTTGGTTQNIGMVAGGFADSAAQDAFCTGGTCTISMLYDQSGKGNDLKEAPAGCYTGTASEADYESSATTRSLMISGHKVYALYMKAHEGYRNNTGNGMATGTAAQSVYEVADGKRIGAACCWDFGNASKNNCNGPTGSMNALFFGTGFWGKGQAPGPWFLGDFEDGVWATGSKPNGTGVTFDTNNNLPASTMDYAFGILKTSTTSAPQYAIRVGNAQSGNLTTAYDGQAPATWQQKGGIILGIGGDNSNSSLGTFFEGAVTAGRPSDATDAAVLANVQAAKYGQ